MPMTPAWRFPSYPPEPLRPPSHPRRVVVVGAGAAGLMATRLLDQAGYDVTLLEASNRAGGRIRTLREPFSPGLYVDTGAAFIPCNHTYTVGLARDLGLTFSEYVPSRGATRSDLVGADYMNGTLVRDPHRATTWPVDLRDDERGKTVGELLQRYIGRDLEAVADGPNPRDPDWPPPGLATLDGWSFLQLLEERGASAGASDLLSMGLADLWGEGVGSVSALSVLRDLAMTLSAGGDTCREAQSLHHPGIRLPKGFHPDPEAGENVSQLAVEGGNEHLPARLAEALGARVRFRSVVRAVRVQQDGTVEIVVDGDGREILRADRVILAVPASTLGRIQVLPGLSEAKRRAFGELGQTAVARTFFEFETRFWEASGLSGGCYTDLPEEVTATGAPGLWINNQTYTQDTERGILDLYAVGPFARQLADELPEARNALLMEQVEKVFPGAKAAFARQGSWFWEYHPEAVAGYPYFLPGQLTAFGHELARPEGPVHFAGDHTSALPGWMQGAFESGERAAREVQDALA